MALDITLAVWVALELGLRVREGVQGKGSTAGDRATRVLIALAVGLAVGVAVAGAANAAAPRIARSAGLIVTWLGLAIRVWAIAALGGAFRTTVEVDRGQPVVSSGPYRWVRHPSYSGLLLIVIGFGVASGKWFALILCVALPLPAVLWRIHVEEAELTRVLGDDYRSYRARTKRLIPGLW